MRVLHINCNYIGNGLHQLMVEELEKKGVEGLVFAATYDKRLARCTPKPNVVVSECFKKWDRLLFDYKQSKIFRAVNDTSCIKDCNLINAATLFSDGNCARNLSKKYGIPYVVAVRNTDVNDFFRLMPHLRHRGVQIMLDAQAVFFLSESYRKQVFEKYVPQKYQEAIQKKTHILPNGIDDFWFTNAPQTEKVLTNSIKLVYAGRIDRNKNIPTTQKAMRLLKEKGYNCSLTVVGRVEDKKELSVIQADPYTTYYAAMPKEELIEVYRNADIFVMPSFTESFGLVYAEAMSQGLPVIYSKGQGFDGQFPEGTVGFAVDAHSAQSVADGIEKVIKEYNSIKNNVVDAAKKFNWSAIVDSYSKIYQDILK